METIEIQQWKQLDSTMRTIEIQQWKQLDSTMRTMRDNKTTATSRWLL